MPLLKLHSQRWLSGRLIWQWSALGIGCFCHDASIGIAFEAIEIESGPKAIVVRSDASSSPLLFLVVTSWTTPVRASSSVRASLESSLFFCITLPRRNVVFHGDDVAGQLFCDALLDSLV